MARNSRHSRRSSAPMSRLAPPASTLRSTGSTSWPPGECYATSLHDICSRTRGDCDFANRFFSPGEVLSLGSLPPQLQIEAFFNCWTRKEAYIKGLGQGLQVPLD